MDHQPFRDWLFTRDELSPEQDHLLKVHLQACDSCSQLDSAWIEVDLALRKAPQLAPAPGFIPRWQATLSTYQENAQKRRGWFTISIITLIVASLLIFSATQLWFLLQAPGPILADWFTRLVNLFSIFITLKNMVSPFTPEQPIYSFIGLFFLTGIVSFMSVLWLATYRKLSMARRTI